MFRYIILMYLDFPRYNVAHESQQKKTGGNLSTRLDSCQVVGISAKRIAFKVENTFSS